MFNIGIMSQFSGLSRTVVLEMLYDGIDNTNTFLDTSDFHRRMVTVGSPTIQGNSGSFDGNGYIYTDGFPAFSDKDYSITGSFSISSWPTGFQDPAIFGYNNPVTVNPMGLLIGADADGLYKYKKLYFFVYDGVSNRHVIIHDADITLNTLHTFEVRRSGGVTRLFFDEVEATTSYASGTEVVISPSSRFCIGKGGSTLNLFNGTVFELVVEQAGTPIPVILLDAQFNALPFVDDTGNFLISNTNVAHSGGALAIFNHASPQNLEFVGSEVFNLQEKLTFEIYFAPTLIAYAAHTLFHIIGATSSLRVDSNGLYGTYSIYIDGALSGNVLENYNIGSGSTYFGYNQTGKLVIVYDPLAGTLQTFVNDVLDIDLTGLTPRVNENRTLYLSSPVASTLSADVDYFKVIKF